MTSNRRPDPARVHAVTLGIWLSSVVALFLIWAFPRLFGALFLMIAGVVAYVLLYAFVDARLAAGALGVDAEDEPTPPPPRRRRRSRKSRTPANGSTTTAAPS